MSSISQLDDLIERARQAGFIVRYEYLGGIGGGVCDFSGKRWIFIDLAQSTEESWESLRETLNDVLGSHSSGGPVSSRNASSKGASVVDAARKAA